MIDTITQYILSLVPAVTAVVGMCTVVGIGIAKIKKANNEARSEIKEIHNENVELRRELIDTLKENKELKRDIRQITSRMSHMYYIEEEEK